jgi:hypothetical protein
MFGTSGTFVREATGNDFAYIDSLRKKEGSALGFMPKDAYMSVLEKKRIANRDRWKYQRLWVTVDGGDLTGFCYSSFHKSPATVIQIVVQQDARRWHRAFMLEAEVVAEAKRRGLTGIKCRVAADLESNFYWKAMGYLPTEVCVSTWLNQRESKSKRQIILYYKQIELPLFGKHDNSLVFSGVTHGL